MSSWPMIRPESPVDKPILVKASLFGYFRRDSKMETDESDLHLKSN